MVEGAFFSFAFGAVDVDAAGLGVALDEVFAAGFCAQPPVTRANALNRNRNFFIDPPNRCLSCKLILARSSGKLLLRHLTHCREISVNDFLKSRATLNEKRAISQKQFEMGERVRSPTVREGNFGN